MMTRKTARASPRCGSQWPTNGRPVTDLHTGLEKFERWVKQSFAACIFRRQVAATPRPRRGNSVQTGRGDATAATWKLRADGSRRRRGLEFDGTFESAPAPTSRCILKRATRPESRM